MIVPVIAPQTPADGAFTHSTPVDIALFADSNCPFVPAVTAEYVPAAVPARTSPFAVKVESSTFASNADCRSVWLDNVPVILPQVPPPPAPAEGVKVGSRD